MVMTLSRFRGLTMMLLGSLAVSLTSCSGGGGGGEGGLTVTSGSGAAMHGALQFANVTFYELKADGTKGGVLGGTSTGTNGTFNFVLTQQSSTGCILVETSGGIYVDEVTGQSFTFPKKLQTVYCSPTGTSGWIALTPFTTMAAARVIALAASGTDLRTAVESANAGVSQQYLIDIVGTLPFDPTDATTAKAANREQRDYALLLGGLSDLANTLGVRTDDLGAALAEDLKDGLLDGKNASIPVSVPLTTGGTTPLAASAGTRDLQVAVNRFAASAKNQTGRTQKIIASTAVPTGVTQPSTLFVNTWTVPPFVAGASGSFALKAQGGTLGYRWAQTSGTLPANLRLTESGDILADRPMLFGGTVEAIGIVTVTVTDDAGNTASATFAVRVIAPPPTITCRSPLPAAEEGKPYLEEAAEATGGVTPLYFKSDTFLNGAPPLGLVIDLNGNLTGTPFQAGVYGPFGICVVDLNGSESCCQSPGLVVNEPGVPPFGFEVWSGTYSGTFVYNCPPNNDTFDYDNSPMSFEIQSGVVSETSPQNDAGTVTGTQIMFGDASQGNYVFTGALDQANGTASGTWTRHIPGQCFQAGDGSGTWFATRTFP